ncbi:unnamed protein product [Schistocephalus solidus]|uniref:Uncharacterized protein n=1 Tax=Schistocephalus solidus TaxID=70667 RepID=A0A183TK84_SCHSO|nr:unnamed protein product [Schistocephalus solidus]
MIAMIMVKGTKMLLGCKLNVICLHLQGEFFWIDNDSFEACSVELTVLRNAVNSFPVAEPEVTSSAAL